MVQSWLYLHNQTVNIFTYLIPGLIMLVLYLAFLYVFTQWSPDATIADRAVFHLYLRACSLCFGASATYYTLLCYYHEIADLWVRLDYVSISVLILASFVPGLHMGLLLRTFLIKG